MSSIFDPSPRRRPARTDSTDPGRAFPRPITARRDAPTAPTAAVICDRPRLAASLRGLLQELGYRVEVLPGPEDPWRHAAGRDDALVVVDLPWAALPDDDGLDLRRCVAVRPPDVGPDYDAAARRQGLRSVVGRRHPAEELLALLGGPAPPGPATAEALPAITDQDLAADPEPAGVAVAPRRRVDDRYLLLEVLAPPPEERWAAFDERGLVDVEVHLRAGPCSPMRVRRFLDVGRTSKRLQHPNAVTLLDVGQWGDTLFAVTEPLPSTSLRERLDDATGPLPVHVAAHIGRQLASVLDLAHRRGVFHGALEPSRVLLLPGDAVKLADLAGLRALDPALGEPLPAGVRALYLAPEQRERRPGRASEADAWGLGALLYERLAGVPPAPPLRALRALNPGVPPGLSEIVRTLLAPEPADRPSDLRAIAERLFACEAPRGRLAWTPPAHA
jgi:hypothetical protein